MNCKDLKIIQSLSLILLVTMGAGSLSYAVPSPSAPSPMAPRTVKGEVVMISGDLYVSEDTTGKKEVQMIMDEVTVLQDVGDEATSFDVNESTQVEDTVEVGDTVEVLVSGDRRALSIRKTQ